MVQRTSFDIFMSASRINKLFLDMLKTEFDRMRVADITGVQAVILYNIGLSKISVGDIIHRGYYIGSNVSYNLKKMLDSGYIEQHVSDHDKRLIQIKLSKKGVDFYDKIRKRIAENSSLSPAGNVMTTYQNMESFERFLAGNNIHQ